MRLARCVGFLCLLATLVGCEPPAVDAPDPATVDFGQFEGDVVAQWGADGRTMTLREGLTYIDSQGRRWLAPAGSVVDGASIPRLFWSVIGGPFEGKYRNASVIHDVGCVEMRQSWQDVHRMFYEACRCGGVDEAHAKIMYYAVYHFGPRWEPIVENVIEQATDAAGQMVEREVAVQHIVRVDPPPPTPDELDQVKAYIEEEDPQPAAIAHFTRDSLRRRPSHRKHGSSPRSGADAAPRVTERDPSAWSDRTTQAQPDLRRLPSPSGMEPRTRQSDELASRMRAVPQRSAADRWTGGPAGAERQLPPLTQYEQEQVTQIVRQHLEQQAGAARPAEYQVQRLRSGYQVRVQFLHEDEQGQLVPYAGGTCLVRVSRDGQVREVVNEAD